ncbi:MAG: hypothetical protein HQ557_18675 [Bacteroidetes bacterium]|nr:hypothetical protein [Bacteroidota bacterium]
MKNSKTCQAQKTSLQAIVKILIILLLLSFSACSTPVTSIVSEPEQAAPSETAVGTNEDSPLVAILNEAGRQPALSPAPLPPSAETALAAPEQSHEAAPIVEPVDIEERPIYLNALNTRQKTYSLTASFLDRTAVIGVISLPKSIETAVTGESRTFSVTVSSESTRAGEGKTGTLNSLKPSAVHSYIEPVSIIKVTRPESVKQISPAYSAIQNTTPSLVRFNFSSGVGIWLALAIAAVISGTAAVILIPKRKKRELQ